ncbi:MAG: NAD(+)/NADH kinase [Clostridiales bacterium]|nr:NAD(+)/NADH kinase [Clostridiales bacterium]
MDKKIYIHTNDTDVSKKTKELLAKKLDKSGYLVVSEVEDDTELIVCIGGDGSFLEAIHKFDFPHIPFIGINTGHLGFFQEILPEQLDEFIFNYGQGRYSLQPLSTVKAVVIAGDAKTELHALNEIVIKSENSHSIHLNISIGGSFIERFSGDGILIASPAGSTGYNYSLGGSIVDPRLKLLQVTPIAPMNTTAYRSFTSSILLPPDMTIGISPEESRGGIVIAADSLEYKFDRISGVNVSLASTYVNLLRFESYDFWNKVKTKFL